MMKTIFTIFFILFLLAGNAALIWYLPEESPFYWVKFVAVIISILIVICIVIIELKKQQDEKTSLEEKAEEFERKRDMRQIDLVFKKATQRIRGRGINRLRSVYDLPWYLVLGSKQGAKSSILEQNGFETVLQHNVNEKGTDHLIKFWCNEKAVVIEVGFALFDQERRDEPLFEYLLQKLGNYRPRQAINGVIAVVSCEHLLVVDRQHLQKMSGVFHDTLLFLNGYFQMKFPVYPLFAKADLIADFTEFFGSFARVDTNNPFGITLACDKTRQFDKAEFSFHQEQLLRSVMDQQFERLRSIGDENAGSVIAVPYQLRMVFERITQFFVEISKENRMGEYVWLRCAYLFSCTQTGQKYDLLTQIIAERSRFGTQSIIEKPSTIYSLFAASLFAQVILPEKNIVGVHDIKHKLYLATRSLGLFAVFLIVMALIINMKNNWDNEDKWRVDALSKMRIYDIESQRLKTQATDFSVMARVLNELRSVTYEGIVEKPWYSRISYRQPEVASQMYSTYEEQLKRILLPALEVVVRGELGAAINASDQRRIFLGLRNYQTLFSADFLQIDELHDYLLERLEEIDGLAASDLENLSLLITDLFNSDYSNRAVPNAELISIASRALDGVSLERLIYTQILALPEFQMQADIRSQFGDRFNTVFEFTSGFTGYVFPEIFTSNGYDNIDFSETSELLNKQLSEFKAIKNDPSPNTDVEMAQLSQAVQNLYFADYIKFWRALISNINIKSFDSRAELVDGLRIARETATSPVTQVLEAITVNVMLGVEVDDTGSASRGNIRLPSGIPGVPAAVRKGVRVTNSINRIRNRKAVAGESFVDPAFVVDDAFASILSFTGGEVETSPMNGFIADLNALYYYYESALTNPDSNKVIYDYAVTYAAGETNPILTLKETTNAPEQVMVWARSFARQAWKDVMAGSKNYINRAWNQNVYRDYVRNIRGRFPFASQESEVDLDEFIQFFQPQGNLDNFIDEVLSPFVQWQNNQLQTKVIDGERLALSSQTLNRFNQTRRITQLFFGGNGQALSLKVRLRPQLLSPNVTRFELNESQPVFSYSHGPRIWSDVTWPSINGADNVLRASFYSAANRLSTKTYRGEWALFRALFDGTSSTTSARLIRRLNYKLNDYQFVYDYSITGSGLPLSRNMFTQYALASELR